MTITPKTILVGVAWPYCNGEKHIGQIAGAYLPPDIFARYQRMIG
jgi:methionyl-tRNA synthetase